MRSKFAVAVLVLAFMAGPTSASECEVILTVPSTTSAGAVLTLDASLVPVVAGSDVTRVLYVGQSVEAGEILYTTVSDVSKALDYLTEYVLHVLYPSGNTESKSYTCAMIGEWISEDGGCDCEWVED